MSERFYIKWPLQPGPIYLDGPEARHLAVVCRLRPDDEVCLFNGDGHEYPARVTEVGRREVALDIIGQGTPQRELGFSLEVAVPLPRGDRSQFLIEKLTELGVTTFVPLACQRSVIHPREGRLDKLERHVIEASKQCGRNILMNIAPPMPWVDYCTRRADSGTLSFLAHPGKTGNPVNMGNLGERPSSYRLAIGPEGGFTDEEIDLALEHGWQPVTLGPRILRVETAAIALAARVALL